MQYAVRSVFLSQIYFFFLKDVQELCINILREKNG
jgi:hypothetical protein